VRHALVSLYNRKWRRSKKKGVGLFEPWSTHAEILILVHPVFGSSPPQMLFSGCSLAFNLRGGHYGLEIGVYIG
jgi:hypothetical protein